MAYQRSKTDRIRAATDRLRQVTESFSKAVELLGHPERSVRLGAIYALERIARQNRAEHWPIMETLSAFIRERAPAPWPNSGEVESLRRAEKRPRPPPDIQAALIVIGRRRHEYYPKDPALDFAGTDLPVATFSYAYLANANLSGAILDGALFADAHLVGAYLSGAYLTGAVFAGADVKGAVFTGAHLEGSDISQEQLNSAIGDKDTKIPEGLTRPDHWS